MLYGGLITTEPFVFNKTPKTVQSGQAISGSSMTFFTQSSELV